MTSKKRQPPLLDPSGDDLPSPLFTPRPGWGGQLREWLRGNASALLFRLVLFAALILVGVSITKNRPAGEALPSESPEAIAEAYTQTARRGDTLTHLAARALDAYLKETQRSLDGVEHLWATDRLTYAMLAMSSVRIPMDIEPGQEIRFPMPAIEYAISEAESLTPGQRTNLQRYLK